MVSRPMILVMIAFEVGWFLLWTASYSLSLVSIGMVVATERVAESSSPRNQRNATNSVRILNQNFADNAKAASNTANHLPPSPPQRQRSFLLGVMVDAGRNEFSVDWIQAFMEHIHKMGFNALHLTLANDQRFACAAAAAPTQFGKNATTARREETLYATKDLHSLAKHARSLDNMTLIPEVSLPFFAASWAGMGVTNANKKTKEADPNIALAPLPCPRYICSPLAVMGTNLPLDIRHPTIREIVSGVLQSVVEGLEKPAYLHLGALSSTSASHHGCWKEVLQQKAAKPPDYIGFEKTLAKIVTEDLGYQPRMIRRLEESSDRSNKAVGVGNDTLLQYPDHPANPSAGSYLLQPSKLNLATTLLKDHLTGWAVYQETMEILNAHQSHYEEGSFEGMIISTESLPPSWFQDRNVMGRLLAISMAAKHFEEDQMKPSNSNVHTNQAQFEQAYGLLCKEFFPSDDSKQPKFCHRLGGLTMDPSSIPKDGIGSSNQNLHDPKVQQLIRQQTITEHKYKKEYLNMWDDWAKDICHRLTETMDELKMQTPAVAVMDSIREDAFSAYWHGFNDNISSNYESQERVSVAKSEGALKLRQDRPPPESLVAHDSFRHIQVPFRGLIVDLVDEMVTPEAIEDLMEQIMVPLGLNTLQLSLINRLGCSLKLKSLEGLYHRVPTPPKDVKPLSDAVLQQIVATGDRWGIEIIPEISITSHATGWYHAGFLVNCPHTLCSADSSNGASPVNGAVANDVNNGSLLPVVLRIIQKLRTIFRSGSFLHLGSDERLASEACWKESGKTPDYDRFEGILSSLLGTKNWYNSSNILRWENQEGIVYPQRTGKITQYQYGRPTLLLDKRNASSPAIHEESEAVVFGSLSITPDKDPWTIYQETKRWANNQDSIPPKGLLARIRLNNLNTNNPDQYKARILAFAIGLSSEIPLLEDPSSLTAFMTQICATDNPYLCPSHSKEKNTRFQPVNPRRGQMLCKAMTRTISSPVMRSQNSSLESLGQADGSSSIMELETN